MGCILLFQPQIMSSLSNSSDDVGPWEDEVACIWCHYIAHPGYVTCCKLCLRTQGEGHDEMCSRINIKVKSSFDRTGKTNVPRPRAKNTDEEQCARNPAVRTEYRSLGDKKKDEEPDTSTAASSSSAVGTESKSRGHSSERQAPFRSASRNQPSGTATEGGTA